MKLTRRDIRTLIESIVLNESTREFSINAGQIQSVLDDYQKILEILQKAQKKFKSANITALNGLGNKTEFFRADSESNLVEKLELIVASFKQMLSIANKSEISGADFNNIDKIFKKILAKHANLSQYEEGYKSSLSILEINYPEDLRTFFTIAKVLKNNMGASLDKYGILGSSITVLQNNLSHPEAANQMITRKGEKKLPTNESRRQKRY